MSVINTNVKSLVAQASLAANSKNQATAMERLSTGSRINSAKDDAAGLAIGSRMTSQVRGLNMAIRNANDGISLAQTAEGALDETTSMLQRMRELSLQAANTVNNASDRAALDAEVQQLKTEIDRIATTTTFNGQKILDGSFSGDLQIGDKAGQTMQLAVASMATTAMGETASGLAQTATRAALTVTGASTTVADYQGASFTATVNGVAKTITLPVATSSQIAVGGAKAEGVAVGADSAVDNSSTGVVMALPKLSINASAANGKLFLAVNGGTAQDINIQASKYYNDNTKATGTEIVAALQAEIDLNGTFSGSNALTVSLTPAGRISIAFANGSDGTVSMSQDAGNTTHTLVNALTGANTARTSNSGTLEVVPAARMLDLSANSSFTAGGNNFDLAAAINSRGYDAALLTASEFVTVYNDTAKVGGVSVSSVAADDEGVLTFSGAQPTAPINFPGAVGSMVGTVAQAAGGISNSFQDITGGTKLLSEAIAVAGAADNTVTVKLGDTSVSVDVTAKTYYTMSRLAEEIQGKLDSIGAFSGIDTVTVGVVTSSTNTEGLSFTSANGAKIEVSGDFFTGNNAVAGGNLLASTVSTGGVAYDSTNSKVVIDSPTAPTGIGALRFTEQTVALNGNAKDTKFTLNVNGNGNVALDLASAITTRGYTSSAMTGTQLVNVLNDTIQANGNFVGNDAVTASLTSDGQLKLQVAGAPVGGGNPSLIIDDDNNTTTNFVNIITNVADGTAAAGVAIAADASGSLLISGAGDKEKFGVASLAVGALQGNNELTVTVGSGVAKTITVATATYADANALASALNTSLTNSGLFTDDPVTASVSTDATTGAQSISFRSSQGASVTVGGTLATDLKSTEGFATSVQTIAATGTTGATFDNTDTISFKYNGTLFTTALLNAAGATANNVAALQLKIEAATDSAGNTFGAGKIVVSQPTTTTVLTLNQTGDSKASLTDSLSDVIWNDGATPVKAASTGSLAQFSLAGAGTRPVIGDKLSFTYNGVNYSKVLDTAVATAANMNTNIAAAVDKDGNALGAAKVTFLDDAVVTTSGALTAAAGNSISNISLVRKAAADMAAYTTLFAADRVAQGGVDLSADNNVTVGITNAAGVVTSQTFALGSSASSVSFSDYASLLQTAADTAFSASGVTFTAAFADGKLSLQSNQSDVSNVALSGTSVSDAVGGAVSGTNPTAVGAVNKFYTMSDVAAAITEDLGDDAVASFDSATNSLKFEVTAGVTGTGNTIALSGAGLSALQIAGNLTAAGTVGEASASNLSTITVDTIANANAATSSIDNAIEYVNSQRASLGAIQNRLDHTVSNLTNISTNTEAARSRIMDADYGQESAALAKAQIIQQAATAMLAQANQSSQSVLSLLQ